MKQRQKMFTLAAALATGGALARALLAGDPAPPEVSVADVNPGTSVERDLCLSVSLAPGAASECGDLRLAHALPAVRTLNRARAPVLLYNSQHASPHPIVAAHVTLPSGKDGLSRVVATLKVNGTPRGQGVWKGSAWPDVTGPVRIAVGYDAAGDSTGPYRYTLEVRAHYGETMLADTARGELVVVNRRESVFGAGWWLAGLERLVMDPFGKPVLWVGGDGSTRRYTAARGDSVWGAPSLDRPDSIKKTADGWERILGGGVKVEFDSTGRHIATVNRLSQRSEFLYDDEGRVTTATIPEPAGNIQPVYPIHTFKFSFVYGADGRLERAESPLVGSTPRVTWIRQNGMRVDSIRDPDGKGVTFGYSGSALVPTSRTNRLGVPTYFRYDDAGRIAGARIDPNDTDSIVTRLRAVESLGLSVNGAGAVDTALAYALLDGPRTDVGDSTRLWLDRWGAPRRIRNALSRETVFTRSNPRFPVLVTRVRHPNGFEESATYDLRGRVVATRKHAPLEDGDSSATRYAYDDPRWPDFATRVELPEGEVTETGYDAAGNRAWQQEGPAKALSLGTPFAAVVHRTRATFHYDAQHRYTHTCTAVERRSGCIDGDRPGQEWTLYDARGNLAATRTPIGFWTVYDRDALGRDSVTYFPIDSARSLTPTAVRAHGQRQTVTYKTNTDLAARVETYGPAREYVRFRPGTAAMTEQVEALTLKVDNLYDDAGQMVRTDRSSSPDLAEVGTLTLRWRYDRAGRRVAEESVISASGRVAVDSTVYDAAGNVREAHTRRGTVAMQYDALGRLLRRSVGAATDSFRYDVMGRMTLADNQHARIRRSYFAGGGLRTDSQTIVAGTTAQSYGLEFGYDRNGRRSWILHPANLSPSGADTTRYGYDPASGMLMEVKGKLGWGSYGYDDDGQVLRRNQEMREFDADGRMVTHSIPGHQTPTIRYDARGKALRVEHSIGSHEELAYDGLGHLVWSRHPGTSAPQEEYRTDAMANTVWRRVTQERQEHWWEPSEVVHTHEYEMKTGRLARIRSRAPQFRPEGTSWGPDSILAYRDAAYEYNDAGDRLEERERTGSMHHSIAAAPVPADGAAPTTSTCGATRAYVDGSRGSSYDATGRVTGQRKAWGQYVSVETSAEQGGAHPCREGWVLETPPSYAMRMVDESFGYDALGRRVWVATRSDRTHCAGTAWPGGPPMGADVDHCDNSVRRAVWDGDQILWEMKYPDLQQDTGLDARNRTAKANRDSGTPPKGGLNTSRWSQFGRVAYTHGGEVDRPLAVARMDYSYDLPAIVVLQPYTSWRGVYVVAVGDLPCVQVDTMTQDLPPDPGYPNPPVDTMIRYERRCHRVDLPGLYTDKMLSLPPHQVENGPAAWHGSLLLDQRDASGTLYRRNRYYDPSSGRFTQEDPIGLAGGVNLYGFANGDPVSYDDPYGLCPWCVVFVAAVRAAPYVAAVGKLTLEALDPNPDAGTAIVTGGRAVARGITNVADDVGPTVGALRAAGRKDAHHVIQDAAVRDLPGYNTNAAPGLQLLGPASARGTPHHAATQAQRRAGGGTYGAERKIGYRALRAAGVSADEARANIVRADHYFNSLGVQTSTPTRIPGNRPR
jgi:RHS repeat-associated protein